MTRTHYLIHAILAALCLASCTTAQKDAGTKFLTAVENRAIADGKRVLDAELKKNGL